MSYRHKHIKAKVHKLKPKKPFYRYGYFWLVLLCLAVFGLFMYFLFFFPKIQVTDIKISGNKKIETQAIKNIIESNIEKNVLGFGNLKLVSKTILLVDEKDIAADLIKNYPSIEEVKINKKLPQTIIAEVKERAPFAVFCKSGEETIPPQDCYFIDTAGVIFDSLPEVPAGMTIVRQSVNNDAFVGENVIAENIMKAIEKISKNLQDNFQINIEEAMVSTPVRLNIKTEENWQIYFNLGLDVDLQITKLDLLLKEEISQNSRESLQYIDLRYKDKTYYK